MNEEDIDLDAISLNEPDRSPASQDIDLDAVSVAPTSEGDIDLDSVVSQPKSGVDRLKGLIQAVTPAPIGLLLGKSADVIEAGIEGVGEAFQQVDQTAAEYEAASGSKLYEWRMAKAMASIGGSTISSALDVLAIPSKMVAAGAVETAELFAPGVKKVLNPEGKIVPDIMINDVINYYTPDADEVERRLTEKGYAPATAETISNAYWAIRGGVGLAATVVTDPLVAGKVRAFQRTAKSLAAYKAGDVTTKAERSLISVGAPFTSRRAEIPIPKKVITLSSLAADKVRNVPGVDRTLNIMGDMLDSLNTFTGTPEVDVMRSAHSAIVRGLSERVNQIGARSKQFKLSLDESRIVTGAIEGTPNLRPYGLPETIYRKSVGIQDIPDSKITKKVFHGSPQRVDNFNKNLQKNGLVGPGFYFTEDPSIASKYARELPPYGNIDVEKIIVAENQRKKILEFLEKNPENKAYVGNLPDVRSAGLDELADHFRSKMREAFYTRRINAKKYAEIENFINNDLVRGSSGLVKPGANVFPAFLDIRNPIDVDDLVTAKFAKEFLDYARSGKMVLPQNTEPSIRYFETIAEKYVGKLSVRDFLRDALGYTMETGVYAQELASDFTDVIKGMGYDGITHIGGRFGGSVNHRVWVAFEEDQVLNAFDVSAVAKRLGVPVEELGPQIKAQIQKLSKEKGITLTPAREEELIRAALSVKDDVSTALSVGIMQGVDNLDDLADGLIENYLPHIISKDAKNFIIKAKEIKKGRALTREEMEQIASVIEADAEKTLQQSIRPNKSLTAYDSTRKKREHRTTLALANEKMKEKTGISNWFVEDPFAISAMYASKRYVYAADKALLDSIRKFGQRPDNTAKGMQLRRQLEDQGWAPIKHRDFDNKQVIIREKTADGKDKVIKAFHKEVLFPPNIANKISYQFMARTAANIGNMNALMDGYINIFRTAALFSPGYYIENWMEDIIKGFANGVRHDDFVDSYRVLTNAKGTVKIAGKETPIPEVRRIMETYSVRSSRFSEDAEGILYTGKKVMREQNVSGPFKNAVSKFVDGVVDVTRKTLGTMSVVGNHGQNHIRSAFFINRLKAGYTPQMAAFEVEKYLFDFSRVTKNVSMLRRFMNPFIQVQLKTAQVMPRLIANNPGFYNAYQNVLPHVIERAFHDPLNAEAIKTLYPEYDRIRSRLAGPLLTGDTQLAVWLGINNPDKPGAFGLPSILSLNVPAGLEVVDGLALWNPQVLSQTTSGGILRAMAMVAFGVDPSFGKKEDIDRDVPKDEIWMNRINRAIGGLGEHAFALQTIKSGIDRMMGIKKSSDDLFFEPMMVRAFNSMFGKFGKVTNLDKEAYYKLVNLEKMQKTLESNLSQKMAQDVRGLNASLALKDAPKIAEAINYFRFPKSTVAMAARLAGNTEELMMAVGAKDFINKDMSVPELAGWIENIRQTKAHIKKVYPLAVQEYMKMADEYGADAVLKADEEGEMPDDYVVPKDDITPLDDFFDD